MDITQLLAAILNPNGTQQAQPMPQMAATQVGDHNNPAWLQAAQARLAQPPQTAPQPQMPPQATQAVAEQQQVPQPQQPAPAPSGGLGGLGGILQNIIAPQSAAKNKTVGWLTSQGLDPGTATVLASDKAALRSYVLQRSKSREPNDFDQRAAAAQQYGLDPTTPEGRNFILTGKVGGEADASTSDMKEYNAAVKQGFKGTLMDFMVKMKEAGRNQVNIDTGTKLPSGFMWKDPNNQNLGVVPIPGGPATQLPSEAAGRIGLADSFLSNFDTIRGKVAGGVVTGPVDRFQATNNSSSDAGQVYQAIQTGVDSLQRMLTGAGMPASEAEQYAYRYLPGYTDTAESAAAKLDRLKAELESVQKKVLQGRGGANDASPAAPKAAPAIGETRYGYRFKGGDPSEPSNWEKAN